MTNLIEKGMEKSCSLDSINPHQPDVIELNNKNKEYFCGGKKKKKSYFYMCKFFLQPLTFNISCIRGSGRKETFLLIFPLSVRRMLIFYFFFFHLRSLPAGSRPRKSYSRNSSFWLISFHVLCYFLYIIDFRFCS